MLVATVRHEKLACQELTVDCTGKRDWPELANLLNTRVNRRIHLESILPAKYMGSKDWLYDRTQKTLRIEGNYGATVCVGHTYCGFKETKIYHNVSDVFVQQAAEQLAFDEDAFCRDNGCRVEVTLHSGCVVGVTCG